MQHKLAISSAVVTALIICLILFIRVGHHGSAHTLSSLTCNPSWPKATCDAVLNNIDQSVSPCEDFYQFSCGGWLNNTELPADRAMFSRFSELDDTTKKALQKILNGSWPIVQEFYDSCLDTATMDKVGVPEHLKDLVTTAEQHVQDLDSLLTYMGKLYPYGVAAFFDFWIGADQVEPTLNVLNIVDGGLTMTYENFENSTKRGWLKDHVTQILKLYGFDAAKAVSYAEATLQVESKLAALTPPPGSIRDPKEMQNRYTLAQIKDTHKINLKNMLEGANVDISTIPKNDVYNLYYLQYFTDTAKYMNKEKISVLKKYFIWAIIRTQRTSLTTAFRDATFEFSQHKLMGVEEHRPRWKICADVSDMWLADLIGHYYQISEFPEENKRAVDNMVDYLSHALRKHFEDAQWMDIPTRTSAVVKLDAFLRHIGYPVKWKKWNDVALKSDTFYQNLNLLKNRTVTRDFQKLHQAVDVDEWFMSVYEINAYYDPSTNSINFPAGILQPPYFGAKQPDAVNFGGMGAVIGHEMSHGFDDQGRMFDAKGQLNDWWSKSSAKAYKEKTKCLETHYSQFMLNHNKALRNDGSRTLGENIADNIGIQLAYTAWKNHSATQETPQQPLIQGLTNEQLFYTAFGQVWCFKGRDVAIESRMKNDVHSLPPFRVQGVASNNPGFSEAFGCKANSGMGKLGKTKCDF